MSLILYYRDCFTVDKKIVDVFVGEVDTFTNLSKLFLSEDKRFAGMVCGKLLTKDQWVEIYEIVRSCKQEDISTFAQTGKISKLEIKLQKFIESKYTSSTLVFVYKDMFYAFRYEKGVVGYLDLVDPDIPYMTGTGMYAATVLIQSGQEIDQKRFFEIVSYCDPMVNSDYEMIELKDVIGTPWHDRSKQ